MTNPTTTTRDPARIAVTPADLEAWVRAAKAAGHFVPDHRTAHAFDGDVNFPDDIIDVLGAALTDGRWYLIHSDGTATLHPLQDRCRWCAEYESGGREGGDYDDITCSAACTTAAAENDAADNDTPAQS